MTEDEDNPETREKLLTVKDVAGTYGVHTGVVYGWIRSGPIRALHLGARRGLSVQPRAPRGIRCRQRHDNPCYRRRLLRYRQGRGSLRIFPGGCRRGASGAPAAVTSGALPRARLDGRVRCLSDPACSEVVPRFGVRKAAPG